jgi:hypothetical protein
MFVIHTYEFTQAIIDEHNPEYREDVVVACSRPIASPARYFIRNATLRCPDITSVCLRFSFINEFCGNTMIHLKKLNLSSCGLTKFNDNVLPNLLDLDLTNNPLVSASGNHLDSMTDLEISKSHYSDYNYRCYPPIRDLGVSSLTYLDLSKCILFEFCDFSFPFLEGLFLYETGLVAISKNYLPKLYHLDVQYNPKLTSIDQSLPSLGILHLNYTGVEYIDCDLFELQEPECYALPRSHSKGVLDVLKDLPLPIFEEMSEYIFEGET